MPATTKSSHPATQLTLFQQPRPRPAWEAMPIDNRRQVEQLLARMLREYARRANANLPDREDRDE